MDGSPWKLTLAVVSNLDLHETQLAAESREGTDNISECGDNPGDEVAEELLDFAKSAAKENTKRPYTRKPAVYTVSSRKKLTFTDEPKPPRFLKRKWQPPPKHLKKGSQNKKAGKKSELSVLGTPGFELFIGHRNKAGNFKGIVTPGMRSIWYAQYSKLSDAKRKRYEADAMDGSTDEELDSKQFRIEHRSEDKVDVVGKDDEEDEEDEDEEDAEEEDEDEEDEEEEYGREQETGEEVKIEENKQLMGEKLSLISYEAKDSDPKSHHGNAMNAFVRYRNVRLHMFKKEDPNFKFTKFYKMQVTDEWKKMTNEQTMRYRFDAQAERKRREAAGTLKKRRTKAEIEKSGKKKLEMKKKAKNKSHRQYQSYMSLPSISALYKDLTHQQRDWLCEIGLGGLQYLKILLIPEDFNKFLYSCYHVDDTLRAHGRTVDITDETVGWLFGISFEGDTTFPDYDPQYLQGIEKDIGLSVNFPSTKEYMAWFRKSENKELLSDEWKRRALVVILNWFGLPVAKAGVRRNVSQFVVDLEHVRHVNWAGVFLNHLRKRQLPARAGKRLRGSGCVLIPLVLYLEKFCPLHHDNPKGCKDRNAIPRLKFWNTSDVNNRWAFVIQNMKKLKLKKLDESPRKVEVMEPLVQGNQQMEALAEKVVDKLIEKFGTEQGIDYIWEALMKKKAKKDEEKNEEKEETQNNEERVIKKRPRVEEDQEMTSTSKLIMVSSGTRGNLVSNMSGKQRFIIRRRSAVSNQLANTSGGEYIHHAPGMPTVEDCWLHFYAVHIYESWYGDRNKTLPAKLSTDTVMAIGEYTEVTRRSLWRLRKKEWLDSCIVDNYLMLLHLRESSRPFNGDRRVWFWGCYFSSLESCHYCKITEYFMGDWSEMGYIAVPMNVKDSHWFTMIISFVDKEIFILDSWSGLGYVEDQVNKKIRQIHQTLQNDKEYKKVDITLWNVWYLNDDVPQQTNTHDWGPFMLFFMTHIKDFIPVPKKQYLLDLQYLRIWIANEMAKSPWNTCQQKMYEGIEMAREEKQIEFANMYRKIASISATHDLETAKKKKMKTRK